MRPVVRQVLRSGEGTQWFVTDRRRRLMSHTSCALVNVRCARI